MTILNTLVYEFLGVEDDVILIKDLNGPVSITNAADAVVTELLEWQGRFTADGRPYRIHYIDSMGNRDELLHDGEHFTGFAPVQRHNRTH